MNWRRECRCRCDSRFESSSISALELFRDDAGVSRHVIKTQVPSRPEVGPRHGQSYHVLFT